MIKRILPLFFFGEEEKNVGTLTPTAEKSEWGRAHFGGLGLLRAMAGEARQDDESACQTCLENLYADENF